MPIMAHRTKEEVEEELSRFHGLPPLKRFKLLQRRETILLSACPPRNAFGQREI